MKYWCLTCDDERGPLGGLLPLLDAVLVHLVLHLLQLVHGVQTVSPPLLLHRLAQLRLVGQLLGCLHNLLLQGESALQVPQIRVLLGGGHPEGQREHAGGQTCNGCHGNYFVTNRKYILIHFLFNGGAKSL